MDYTEEQIQDILKKHKNKVEREKKYYHDVLKHKEEYKIKNRQRASNHYHTVGKQMKREAYQKDKEFISNKALYNYYRRNDKMDIFMDKHKGKYDLLIEKGYINKE